MLVLSGAGVSTESGIPDYRGQGSEARRARPMPYREFVGDPGARARYWVRSAIGWPRLAAAGPNAGHRALARMEAAGAVNGIVTQNVDSLHQAAGSLAVLELHGSLADVVCLGCGERESRLAIQERLLAENPVWAAGAFLSAVTAPDGDAVAEPPAGGFRVPDCARCGGILKPDVVFFGENVPRQRVENAYALLGGSDALLVVGSSLSVFSGYRFVMRAAESGKPVVIMNRGATRGDPLAALTLDAPLGETLPILGELLSGR